MNGIWLVVFLTSLVRGKRIVENTSVVSSLGDSVLLLCPTGPSSPGCGSSCSWTGPANLSCSTLPTEVCGAGLHIVFNTSTCACMLEIQTARDQHRGDWVCQMQQDLEEVAVTTDENDIDYDNSTGIRDKSTNHTSLVNNKTSEMELDGVKVKLIRTVLEERRKSLFYIVFFTLAILAKLLLLGVIIFALVIAFCKGGRMPRPVLYPLPSVRRRGRSEGGQEEHQLGENQGDKVFNGRICQIE